MPGGVLAHVLEDVSVFPEGHRRVGVAEQFGHRVEWNALMQGQGAGGVAQVVEASWPLAGHPEVMEISRCYRAIFTVRIWVATDFRPV